MCLRIVNRGGTDYYFASPGLADAVFTRKVAAIGPDGKTMAEIYGAIRKLEVKSRATLEWWLVPLRTGRYQDLVSRQEHTESGMRATVEIR